MDEKEVLIALDNMRQSAREKKREGGEGYGCSANSFGILFSHYHGDVKKEVLRLLQRYQQPSNRADDICQETFLQFCQTILQFEGICSVKTWLYKLAFYKVLHYLEDLRKRPPEERLPDKDELPNEDEIIGENFVEDPDIEKEHCFQKCWQKAIKKMLGAKEGDCTIVLIYFYQGLSIEEIAAKMELTPKATERLLTRCQKKLQEKPDCFTALLLHVKEEIDMSYAELAPILGKPSPSAVGFFLCQCRKKYKLEENQELKRCLEECKN